MLKAGIILVLVALLLAPLTWVLWGRGYNPTGGLIWSLEHDMKLVFSEAKYLDATASAQGGGTAEVDTSRISGAAKRILRHLRSQQGSERVPLAPERSIPMRYVLALALAALGVGLYCCVSPLLWPARKHAA